MPWLLQGTNSASNLTSSGRRWTDDWIAYGKLAEKVHQRTAQRSHAKLIRTHSRWDQVGVKTEKSAVYPNGRKFNWVHTDAQVISVEKDIGWEGTGCLNSKWHFWNQIQWYNGCRCWRDQASRADSIIETWWESAKASRTEIVWGKKAS